MEIALALAGFVVGGTVALLCIDWLSAVLAQRLVGAARTLRRRSTDGSDRQR